MSLHAASVVAAAAYTAAGGGMVVAAAESGGGIATYIGSGAGVVAVSALAEVTRRLMNGSLIARQTKDVEEEIGGAIAAAGQREARLIETVEKVNRTIEDVRDEMRRAREDRR